MPYEEFEYRSLVGRLGEPGSEIVDEKSKVEAFADINLKTMRPTGFLNLSYKGTDIPSSDFSIDAGWKFHVSLDEDEPGNLELGWNLIKDIFIKNKVRMSKVVGQDMHIDDASGQRGKQVTIYSWYNTEKSPEDWLAILRNITQVLVANKVYPGYRCAGSAAKEEKAFVGSNYISYRYQLAAQEGAAVSFKVLPSRQKDLYIGTEALAVANQLPTKDERPGAAAAAGV